MCLQSAHVALLLVHGGGGGGGVGGDGRPVQWTTIGDSLQTAAVPTSSPLH